MTEVRVGDVRRINNIIYVVSYKTDMLQENYTIIYKDGDAQDNLDRKDIENDELLAHYNTWQEAVNSKEFKGD